MRPFERFVKKINGERRERCQASDFKNTWNFQIQSMKRSSILKVEALFSKQSHLKLSFGYKPKTTVAIITYASATTTQEDGL